MRSEALLARAVQVVVFLFAAFGFFLTGIAPPGQQLAKVAVGTGSFVSLVVLLFVSALSAKGVVGGRRKRWLVASGVLFAAAIGFGANYFLQFQRLVIAYPPGTDERNLITGDRPTVRAQNDRRKWGVPYSEVVYRYGGHVEIAYEPDGIEGAERILVAGYVAWILFLASSVFCLSESAMTAFREPGKEGKEPSSVGEDPKTS